MSIAWNSSFACDRHFSLHVLLKEDECSTMSHCCTFLFYFFLIFLHALGLSLGVFCHQSLLLFQDVSQVLSPLPQLLAVSSSNYQIYDDVKYKRAYRPLKPNQRHKRSLNIYASVPVELGDLPAHVLISNEGTVVNLFL